MIHILAAAIANEKEDLERLRTQAEFRKATRNMMLASSALQRALRSLDRGLPPGRALPDSALVLGSGYGELETTIDFLTALAEQGVARPLLFQNSLHNATLGFVALRFSFTGAAMTISNRYFTGEDCLRTACDLLLGGLCSVCAVVTVDTLVPEIRDALRISYPSGTELGEGAAAMVLATEEGRRRLEVGSLASLDLVDRDWRKTVLPRADRPKPIGKFYDSDAIERLASHLSSASPVHGTVELPKPDGSCSRVMLGAGSAAC